MWEEFLGSSKGNSIPLRMAEEEREGGDFSYAGIHVVSQYKYVNTIPGGRSIRLDS